jgi:hypothetical protein
MRAAGRFLIPHVLAWVAASMAMLAVPYVASRVSWGLSSVLDSAGGMHLYELGWGASTSAVDDKHAVLDPRSPGILGVLGVVSAICIAGDFGPRRLPFLSWALPILAALPLAVLTGGMMSGNAAPPDLPGYVPFVVGATFGVIVAGLVGTYWGVILLSDRIASRSVRL